MVWCVWGGVGWVGCGASGVGCVCVTRVCLTDRWAALGGVPGGHVPSVLVAVLWAPHAGAAPIIVSWLRTVRMRGGGRVDPPLCELKHIFLVGHVLGWLRCGVCTSGLWGVCVFRLLRPARRSFVVWLGEVPCVEEFLR